MLPDNEYVVLVTYTFTLGIDMCNFLAIWAILSILLHTVYSQLSHIQALQHIYNTYYQTRTQEAMQHLEQQVTEIQDVMYYRVTHQDFDRVSGVDDRDFVILNLEF